jgi:hypothetical protein
MLNDGLQIAVISVLITAVVLVLVFMLLRRVARQREQAMRQRFPNARMIVRGANFFGQQSKGVIQLRGNGTLVITDTNLVFEGWMPRAEHSIPLNRITAIETPRSFLGKSIISPLLKVVYRTEAGGEDAMAWSVPDLAAAKAQLDQVLG